MRLINLSGKAIDPRRISSFQKVRDYSQYGIRVYFRNGDSTTAWYNSERTRDIDYNWLFEIV
jgi:hypothetical protein